MCGNKKRDAAYFVCNDLIATEPSLRMCGNKTEEKENVWESHWTLSTRTVVEY